MNKLPTLKTLDNSEYFYGHKGCAGCGGSLALRLALKVLGEKTIAVVPANCMSSVGMIFPQLSFGINTIIAPFAATGAVMSGIRAALDGRGDKETVIVGFAGDGGTADIGLQSLSGMIDRNDRAIYICYDNEAYMNTGIQQSSLTPCHTNTTTSPVGKISQGTSRGKKDLMGIAIANDVAYAATASIGYPLDYMKKVSRAAQTDGASFIHVIAPCPTGWGFSSEKTVSLAKEMVDNGLWYLAEYDGNSLHLNTDKTPLPSLESYFHSQSRFRHMTGDDIKAAEAEREFFWKKLRGKR